MLSLQGHQRPFKYPIGRPFRRDGYQQTIALVIIRQWQCAFFVSLHTHPDSLRAVVFTLEQIATALIAHAFCARRAGGNVKHRLATRACAPATEPGDHLFNRQLVIQHRRQTDLLALK